MRIFEIFRGGVATTTETPSSLQLSFSQKKILEETDLLPPTYKIRMCVFFFLLGAFQGFLVVPVNHDDLASQHVTTLWGEYWGEQGYFRVQSGALAIEEARKKHTQKKSRRKTDGNMLIYLNLLKKSVVSIIVVHTHLGKVVVSRCSGHHCGNKKSHTDGNHHGSWCI